MNAPRTAASVGERVRQYGLLMRVDRPIGSLLLMWPTLWALWIAGEGRPDPFITLVFVLGVFLMRSAGCVINDYADRNLDPHVARTRERPLAAGRVTPREALTLFVVLCLTAFALVLTLNRLTLMLSLVALPLAASYPFMKRFTYLPQVHLGVAFGWAVPMAFAAQTNGVPAVAWLILIGVVLWAVAYDTMYAMVDREDDIYVGVKSTAILFGELDRVMIGIVQLCFFVVMLLLGQQLGLGIYYYLSLVAAGGLAIYQQYLIRDRVPSACFKAFLNNNWLGAVIFLGLVAHYATRP
ncbi:MAG: 4-hydroxybenzoate octaprenyltransferase [Gammaproteobacteria bacterium]|nr:4-hydroxybenzoate octaprenyltransferase [Gammaproteobacteria bacterium]NIM73202.1 4-hydroxybenzoate octaprenyltransferase [Gammaproteobacteria bacterium]NIN40038.1 4-hydroxybenzoate octaprenyltransferase [Gammaproteobacteria bacterium]NIO26252.1 4-hydroxybenzoate octaprenyltransferase [Gammaproteobacteria bacterium]NIO66061.1 4-hydroxybenzoate octaprenyltransferase [Gammaproteobacteria bacterium]